GGARAYSRRPAAPPPAESPGDGARTAGRARTRARSEPRRAPVRQDPRARRARPEGRSAPSSVERLHAAPRHRLSPYVGAVPRGRLVGDLHGQEETNPTGQQDLRHHREAKLLLGAIARLRIGIASGDGLRVIEADLPQHVALVVDRGEIIVDDRETKL